MAECELDAVTVSGGTGEGEIINGVYTNIGTNVNGYSVFIKSGSVDFPKVHAVFGGPPGRGAWYIQIAAGSAFVTADTFSVPDCPPEGTYNGVGIFSGQTVTLTEGGSGPPGEDSGITYGFPPGVVALITARHKSVTNYLRLRNQGQI